MTREGRFSFCRLCDGRCSLKLTIEQGKLIRVEEDPQPPPGREGICPKGLAWPEILNHPDRLKYPLRRDGARGEGRWRRISWDEALALTAEKLSELKDKHGARSVVIGLGHPKGLEMMFAHRLASVFGTPNIVSSGHICHLPGELACIYTFGSACYANPEGVPRCIMLWGNSPSETRCGSLSYSQLRTALKHDGQLIVVDPRRTGLAARANIWLRPRPGSDGALALGMLKTIIEERLYDQEFVCKWTTGFEKLEEHLRRYSLERIAELTWVPPEQLMAAARLYATNRPAVLQWGNALDHSVNSFQTLRALAILKAITGNIDLPGGEIVPRRLPLTRPGHFMLLREFPRSSQEMLSGEFKLLARSRVVTRPSAIQAILEEKPYPVKGALLFGTNPLITYPDAQRTYQALRKLEFLAVAELFLTPSAALADVVFPAAANFEFNELAPYPPFDGFILAYPKLLESPGECWSDYRIINQLARQLGLGGYFWQDEEEVLDFILQPSGLSFEDFKERRVLQVSAEVKEYERQGFPTPSGKVNLYSEQLEQLGYSSLPEYVEPSEDLSEEYPLLLTSAKSLLYYHSTGRNLRSLRKIRPEPLTELSPSTAAQLGLREGDWVYIETRKGRIKQKLTLNRSLDPRVVFVSYGWWFPEKGLAELYGWRESNLNILLGGEPPYEPAVGSLNLRGIPCRIFKA